jgi:hypothetical protein
MQSCITTTAGKLKMDTFLKLVAFGYMTGGQEGANRVVGGYVLGFVILAVPAGLAVLGNEFGPVAVIAAIVLLFVLVFWGLYRSDRNAGELNRNLEWRHVQVTPEEELYDAANADYAKARRRDKLAEVQGQSNVEATSRDKLAEVQAQLNEVTGQLNRLQKLLEQPRR